MDNDFSIFSTLRYDPGLRMVANRGPDHAGWNYTHESPVYLLDYHRDRLLKAATNWNWTSAIQKLEGVEGLERLRQGLEEFVGSAQPSPLRMRIVVDRSGDIKFDKADCSEVPIEQLFPRRLPAPNASPGPDEAPKQDEFELVVDSVTTYQSVYTHFKTTKRAFYDAARQKARISPGDQKEVLMVNPQGHTMEGSITTPYFWRRGRWVTPPVSGPSEDDGGQDGVSRRWALERGLAVEESVPADSLQHNEECWLSNGARGFFLARVQL